MKTTKFTGRSAEMRKPTKWLASEDLLGLGDVEVTIEGVFRHLGAEFDGGRKEDVFAVAFAGKKKQLVLNATNRKALVAMFGADVAQWTGKTIKLRVCKVRGFGGGEVPGIRVVVGDTPPADAPRRIELPPKEEEAKPAAECKGCGASVPVALMNEGLCPECDSDPKIPF